METLIARLIKEPGITVKQNALMRDYTSFQIGGPADLMLQPESADALAQCFRILHEASIVPLVIGAGSNLLVSDRGIRGVVIRLAAPMNRTYVQENEIIAEAGISLARLAMTALDAGLSGLEFASGIPGTLGGAIFMNAGAYGGEMKDVTIETEYLDENGALCTLSGKQHTFGYRKSFFSGKPFIILRSRLRLTPGDPEKIRETMRDLNARRKEKQPLNFPSAGSFFKRPEGHFAGRLIEDAGLKGAFVGGAQISKKHAGFMINTGGATAEDVCRLMEQVKETVYKNTGVTLEPEVRFVGEF